MNNGWDKIMAENPVNDFNYSYNFPPKFYIDNWLIINHKYHNTINLIRQKIPHKSVVVLLTHFNDSDDILSFWHDKLENKYISLYSDNGIPIPKKSKNKNKNKNISLVILGDILSYNSLYLNSIIREINPMYLLGFTNTTNPPSQFIGVDLVNL
jgi:hypothetical protein